MPIYPLAELVDLINEKVSVDQLKPSQYVSTENLLPNYAGLEFSTKLPALSSATLFRPKDILVSNIRPYLKKVWQSNIDGGASNDVIVFRAKDGISDEYLATVLRDDSFIDYVMRDAKGVKMPRGDISSILKYPVYYPEAPERQKITECLLSLDELIIAETQLMNSLETQKTGLMQQLFPREGTNIPLRRFPEFQNTAEWKEVAAGEVFSNRIERGNSNLPIYSVTMTEGLTPRASLKRRIDNISSPSANKAVRKGDIAYNMMRMWQGALGVAPEDCMVSPAYVVLRPNDVNPKFFYFLLKLPETLQVLTAHSRGLTEDRLRLYYDDFSKVRLLCPPVPEQDRIAECLSSLENLIAIQGQKILRLVSHKKGLMQQLFPVFSSVAT